MFIFVFFFFYFFQAEDGIRDPSVTGVQTCALPICDGVQCFAGLLVQLGIDLVAAQVILGVGLQFAREPVGADEDDALDNGVAGRGLAGLGHEIGRASCRVRLVTSVDVVSSYSR